MKFFEMPLKEKVNYVQNLFEGVASQYDLMNDLMSFGTHRLWKKHFISRLPIKKTSTILDVAGGTGDIAIQIAKKHAHSNLKIIVCDLTEGMVHHGRDYAYDAGIANIEWVVGTATQLPVPDQSIDGYTISFGLRNIPDVEQALKEAFRVLKPGGFFACLEFSPTQPGLFQNVYHSYLDHVIPFLGRIVSKNEEAYRYLSESILKFKKPEELNELLIQAGFKTATYEPILNQVVCFHQATA